MIKLTVYILFFISFWALWSSPWFTLALYYLNGIMQPKFIWPLYFPSLPGFSLSKWLALFCLLGLSLKFLKNKVDLSIWKYKQNLIIVFMFCLIHISDAFSPYPIYFAGVRGEVVLSSFNTIFVMYFTGLAIVSSSNDYNKTLIYLSAMFAFISIYYSYWANSIYLDNRWELFTNGRLNSPEGTSIGDQNALSALLVMGMPFILYGYFFLKKTWQKWTCLLILPFLWHALFMFGSRGAFLAVAVTTFFIFRTLVVKKRKSKASSNASIELSSDIKFKHVKLIKLGVVVGLLVALVTQGGAMLSRSTETAARAQTSSEEPLNPRLISWAVGKKLILEFPLLGAGPQRFQMASHTLFPGESVHVAHNTFLNFAANTGLPVGIMFLYLFWLSFKSYIYCRDNGIGDFPILDYINRSCSMALLAFFICALFLDMIIFEAFYFILTLNMAKKHFFQKILSEDEKSSQLRQD